MNNSRLLLAIRCFVVLPFVYTFSSALLGGSVAWLVSRIPGMYKEHWWMGFVAFALIGFIVSMCYGIYIWKDK